MGRAHTPRESEADGRSIEEQTSFGGLLDRKMMRCTLTCARMLLLRSCCYVMRRLFLPRPCVWAVAGYPDQSRLR